MSQTYDRLALIHAYVDSLQYQRAHEDLKTHHERRYEALSSALGIDFRNRQGFDFDDERRYLMKVFDQAARRIIETHNLFSGWLEAPKAIHQLYARHRQAIEDINERYKEVHYQLLLDIFTTIFGSVDRVVTSEMLKERGFDDSTAPDPIDYL